MHCCPSVQIGAPDGVVCSGAFYFSLAIRKMAKSKPDKKKPERVPRPAFVMKPPNDDAAAYGWSMGKLRHKNPAADPKDKDPWPGPYVFAVPTDLETRQVYGHNMDFINTGYVQLLMDSEIEIRKGAEAVKEAGYSAASLEEFAKVVNKVFRDKIVPDMVKRFSDVSRLVAEFYAARLAHITKFGDAD